ncbi:unnamed protein product [Clavelina lepadiformis]|uniref:Uncharacterized protein n=1 Tax=Clavelina lepadiformis TaxID=159417 RepID=A0ABP0H738_CLALP
MAVKHVKFDSFLKRTLDAKVYEQVKICDPCIVLSKSEKHSFRFVFLTDEALCITENPPKSILYSILLKDVREVEMVHDSATFLQKELRAIALHIVIRHVSTNSSSINSLYNTRPIGNSKHSSILKTMVGSLLSNPSSNTSGQNSLQKSSIVSGSLSELNVNSHNNTNSQFTDDTTSFSLKNKTLSLESFEDGLSLSGSSATLSDYQASSPRDIFNWKQCDPFQVEVLDSAKDPRSSMCSESSVEEFHLYILNQTSNFFMMLKAVWRYHLLKSTTNFNCLENASNKPISNKVTAALFGGLKEDIVHAVQQSAPLEHVYKYFHELKSVAEGNMTIKNAFWKDAELFVACGHFLHRYSTTGSFFLEDRADEIECMVLVAETLCMMLQQTEAITQCHMVLQKCSSSFYGSMLKALISFPELSGSLKFDDSLKVLSHDYMVAAYDVIYEFIVAAEQVSWNCSEIAQLTFSTHTLYSVLNSQPNLNMFMDHIMKECVKMWASGPDDMNSSQFSPKSVNSSHNSPLSPSQAVVIYRNFTVLHRCLTKCASVKLHAREKFKEEFKYYIRPEKLEMKLPSLYPVSGIARNITSCVACIVLESSNIGHSGRKYGSPSKSQNTKNIS